MSDPYDPIEAAFRNLNNANLLAAKDARIRQLEAEVERLTNELNYRKAIAIRVGIEAAKEGKPRA